MRPDEEEERDNSAEEESSAKNSLKDEEEESEKDQQEENELKDDSYADPSNQLSEGGEDEDAEDTSGKAERASENSGEIPFDKKELYKDVDRDTYSFHEKGENLNKKRGRGKQGNIDRKRKKIKRQSEIARDNSDLGSQNQNERGMDYDYQQGEEDEEPNEFEDKPVIKLINETKASKPRGKKNEPEGHSTEFHSLEERYERKAKELIDRMHSAFEEDMESLKNRKPAIKRLKLIKEAQSDLTNISIQKEFLKLDGLNVLPRWLSKLPDGTLPSNEMKLRVLETLAILRVDSSNIKSSQIDENYEVKKLAKKIMEEWSRILLDQRISYKTEEEGQEDERFRNQMREVREAKANQIKKPNEIDGISGQEVNKQAHSDAMRFSFSRSAPSKSEKNLTPKVSDDQKDFLRVLNNMTSKKKK